MKFNPLIIALGLALAGGAQAQNQNQSTAQQPAQSQPSGAQSASGQSSAGASGSISSSGAAGQNATESLSRVSTNTPPGRAFDPQNPPPGRPFTSGARGASQGRPFESQSGGASATLPGQTTSPSAADSASRSGALNTPSSGAGQQQSAAPRSASGAPTNQISGSISGVTPLNPADAAQSSGTPGASGAQRGSAASSTTSSTLDAQGRPPAQQTGASADQSATTSSASATATTSLNWQVFQRNATITPEHREQFRTALVSMAPAGRQVSQEFVTRFVDDLSLYLPRVSLAPVQPVLTRAIQTVLTTSTLAPAQLESVMKDVRISLVGAGLPPVAAQTIACDLHLIAADLHGDKILIQGR